MASYGLKPGTLKGELCIKYSHSLGIVMYKMLQNMIMGTISASACIKYLQKERLRCGIAIIFFCLFF